MRAASTAAFFALSTPTVGDGNARRHLDDREQRVEPVEHAHRRAERNADHGQRRCEPRRRPAVLPQGRRRRSGPEATIGGRARVLRDRVGRAVCRAHVELPRDPDARRARRTRAACARGPTRSRRGCRPAARHGSLAHPSLVVAGIAPMSVRSSCPRLDRRRRRRSRALPHGVERDAGHRQDPAAVRDQPAVVARRAAVEDECAGAPRRGRYRRSGA